MSLKTRGFVSLGILILFVITVGCGPNNGENADSGGAGNGNTKRVILLTNGDDPFWDAMRTGMEKGEEDFDLASVGLRVEMDKNQNKTKGQIDKLKQYAGQTDIAVVAISITDANSLALSKAMKDLAATGVKVITIDSDVDRKKFGDSRIAYLGTDNIIGGRELGKAAKGLMPDGGSYAEFYGFAAAANVVERTSGFAEAAGGEFKKVDSLSDDINETDAQINVRNALENHPEITMLVGIYAYNAHAIVTVVKERDIRDKTKIVVFDAATKAIQHMNDGMIDAMVVQNPYQMGYLGTKLMKAIATDDQKTIDEMYPNLGEEGGDVYTTELRVVVPNEDSPLKAEMFAPETKFFTADEFNVWLKERGLTGS